MISLGTDDLRLRKFASFYGNYSFGKLLILPVFSSFKRYGFFGRRSSLLLSLSCCNVANSRGPLWAGSFPNFNRNSTGVRYPNVGYGHALFYIQAHALAYLRS